MTWISVSLGLATALCMATECRAEMRRWTNGAGKVLQAEFAGVEEGRVQLILANGSRAVVELQSLSVEDQVWVKGHPAPTTKTAVGLPPSVAALPPPEKRRMPDQVREPLLYTTIRVVRESQATAFMSPSISSSRPRRSWAWP